MSLLTEGGPEPSGKPGPPKAADPPVASRPGASAATPPTSEDRSSAADPDTTAGDSAADMDLTGGTATADGAAVAVDAGPGAGAAAFAPLPRRRAPRRVPRLLAVRAAIPRPARLTLTALSVLVHGVSSGPAMAWLERRGAHERVRD